FGVFSVMTPCELHMLCLESQSIMATLPQLLNTRQQIARKLAAIDDEARSLRDNLSAIDHELSARFEQLATALGLEVNETPAGPLTTAAGFTRKVAGVEIDEWIRQVLL